MFSAGSALSKLVNYFSVHPCTCKPATSQEVHGHEACIAQTICGQACMAALAPFFFKNEEQKVCEHGGGNSGYCSLQIPQLWAIRFMRPAARIDTISEIQN
jgi:hypothetical protein